MLVTVLVDSKCRTPREPLWNLTSILLILVFIISECKTQMVGDLQNLPWVGKEVKRNGLLIVNYTGRCISCECAHIYANVHTNTKSSTVP